MKFVSPEEAQEKIRQWEKETAIKTRPNIDVCPACQSALTTKEALYGVDTGGENEAVVGFVLTLYACEGCQQHCYSSMAAAA